MKCRRCGRNNPVNTRHCIYCGAQLAMPSKKNNKKQTESVIVCLIIVLTLLLVIIAGVLIYKNHTPRNGGFGGSGGGALPPPAFSSGTVMPSVTPDAGASAEKPHEDEFATTQPKQAKQSEQAEKPNTSISKKDEFLEEADDIEQYSENYLETAETQSEINSESSIVYQKWDALLNEVYQYLKTIISDSGFNRLKESEIAWIAEKEKAIKAAGEEWEGGSGETMAKNMVAIQYTRERCYYLISLIN